MPAVVGYLLLGIVVSPFTPGYVADREQIQLLADVGVVLLLFEVGIEVDLLRIRREQRWLLVASQLQVLITTTIAGVAVWLGGIDLLSALVLGLCVALSSSVVIVNMTRSRRRTTDRPPEEALLGWSVLQDVTGVTLAATAFGHRAVMDLTPDSGHEEHAGRPLHCRAFRGLWFWCGVAAAIQHADAYGGRGHVSRSHNGVRRSGGFAGGARAFDGRRSVIFACLARSYGAGADIVSVRARLGARIGLSVRIDDPVRFGCLGGLLDAARLDGRHRLYRQRSEDSDRLAASRGERGALSARRPDLDR